jgi:hypothetical protein
MTPETTTERAPAARPNRYKLPDALFMETSALILRLAGAPGMQRGIDELVDSAGRVGTSAAVKREFESVYVKFYDSLAEAAGMLPDPSRDRPFEALWAEMEDMLPLFYPGGHKLLSRLARMTHVELGGRFVSPEYLQNVFKAYKQKLEQEGIPEIISDKSTCGVWGGRGSCPCAPEPGDDCRLKEICVTMRSDFIASAKTLSEAGREESKWLSNNFPRLDNAYGKELHRVLGEHPGPVGDLIIFWEVPDGWTILTRDRTFRILGEAHRRQLGVYIARRARAAGGGQCRIRPEAAEVWDQGDLLDYDAKGVCVRAPSAALAKGMRVSVTSPKFGDERRGKVAYVDRDDPSVFGIKFPYRQPRA